MDPLSLVARLAASVAPPRYHTVTYAGVLAAASPWRARVAPVVVDPAGSPAPPKEGTRRGRLNAYRSWAELL